MILNLGIVKPGSTIRIPFNTFGITSGASITMTNFAVGDILVYKDGSTTQRGSTVGFTATTDFDSADGLAGSHLAIIDLADNTTAGFWAAGSEYLVRLASVTVDGATIGGFIARFRIGYPDAVLDTTIASLASQTSFTLTVGPAENDALNGRDICFHDIASAVQVAFGVVLDYVGATKTVTLAAAPTFTIAAGDNVSILGMAPLQAVTSGNKAVVDSNGLIDANTVRVGPTSAGTAQTAKDLGTLLTTAMTESYAADGATMTPAQALHMIWAILSERSVTGTTLTVKKLDGSTTAMTFTTNDATNPSSQTRSA